MTDGVIGIAECPTPDRYVDSEVLTTSDGEVYRQRVISPTGDAKLDEVIAGLADVLTALGMTLSVSVDAPVALDSATLTALEHVSVDNFPASTEISNDVGNPVPVSGTVTITDGSGPVTVDGTVNIGTIPEVEVKNDTGNPLAVQDLNGMVPKIYDAVDLGYTGEDLTSAVFKTGGLAGTTVATLALSYSGGLLDTVVRT